MTEYDHKKKQHIFIPQQYHTQPGWNRQQRERADIRKGIYGKCHMKGQCGTAAGAHASRITAADVYPAELYRKMISSLISRSLHVNNYTPIRLDGDIRWALVHVYTFSLFSCVVLSWRFFKQSGSDELCGKIMTQGVFVKTNFHFYHMPWTDQLPMRECSGLSAADQQSTRSSRPRRPFFVPNLTIMRVYELENPGTSQIIYSLSQYVSRKCVNMHLWHWLGGRGAFKLIAVWSSISEVIQVAIV